MFLNKNERIGVSEGIIILLNNFLNEEDLDNFIRNEEDLFMLHRAIDLKFSFISQNKQSYMNYSINNILQQIDFQNIDNICLILKSALLIQKDDEQYIILLNYISKHLLITKNEDTLLIYLKLLQLAISICLSEAKQEIFKNVASVCNLSNIICDLLQSDSRNIMTFLNVNILPKYLTLNYDTNNILKAIWKNTVESNNLNAFCAILEFFITLDKTQNIYLLINDKKFWLFLQNCLIKNDAVIHKQALYILKMCVLSHQNEDKFETISKIIYWDKICKESMITAWNNLFMLFEISQEKQLHLVEPSYQLLATIKILHSSWLICIFKILLNHSHNAISTYTIVDMLKSNWYEDLSVYETVILSLLPPLNKTENTLTHEIWEHFNYFVQQLSDTKFLLLFKESANIAWVPSTCYQFYSGLLFKHRTILIPLEIIRNVFQNLENLPHKFIRNECINIVVEFMTNIYQNVTVCEFDEYLSIYYILYKHNQSINFNFNKYIVHIKKIIESWKNNYQVILDKAKTILKIIENVLIEKEWFQVNLLKPFQERNFQVDIMDNLCSFLYLQGFQNEVFEYLGYRLNNCKICSIAIPEDVIQLLATDSNKVQVFKLFNQCNSILKSNANNMNQIEIAFGVAVVLLKNCKYFSNKIDNSVIQNWKENFINGKMYSTEICGSFLYMYCRKDFCENTELMLIFEKIFDIQSNTIVPQIFAHLKTLIEIHDVNDKLFQFIDICLQKLFELKGTQMFKSAMYNFTESIFLNLKVVENNFTLIEKVASIAWKLLELGISFEDAAYSLAINLHTLIKLNPKVAIIFIPIIAELLLFGDIHKKDERAEYHVFQTIFRKTSRVINDNLNFRKIVIRGGTANTIWTLLNSDCISEKNGIEFSDKLTAILLSKYVLHFNKRYFPDSQIHLQKLRILQALLLVHNNIKSQKEFLIEFLMDSVCTESHQVSIKFFIIWLLIRLLLLESKCLDIIKFKMEAASKVHQSSIITFIPVLYQIAILRNDESTFENVFQIMLPWTMGPHFNLRFYAQYGIIKLYQSANEKGYVNICVKYDVTVSCIRDVFKNTQRQINFVDKFIFEIFNAQIHYNLQMIYFDFPSFTNITLEEYENILYVIDNSSNELISSYMKKYKINKDQKTVSQTQESNLNIIQKKIVPFMIPYNNENAQRKVGELVVIASLINKAPNLGGLSRTCEIFGVKQFIINSTSIIKDRDFQSVSMSSENWIDIVEVKAKNLQSILIKMKEDGYKIIGAEQTSQSIQLSNFQFPKKCILLLGNEKEGIPPNLLSLLDYCLEIVQFGVVRSLNVHVAAATFIWEYTKQHMI